MSLDSVKFLRRLDVFMLKEHRDVVEHRLFGELASYGSQEFHEKRAAGIGTA